MPLPTFFIIGAAKAGTTSLYYYLAQHPQIQMSAIKEPNFFSGPENGIPYVPPRVSCLDQYERLFDSAASVRGEASPGYTSYPRRQGVAERIKALVPQAKFIYLVRDPITRTVSHYQDSVAIGKQRKPIAEALGDLSDPYLPLICHSLYAQQLRCYLRHFSEERLLVIDQADLLTDRRSTLREIFAFLLVDDAFDSHRFDETQYQSEGRPVYSRSYLQFVERFLAPPARRIPLGIRRPARRTAERILLPTIRKPTLDARLRARLEDFYAADVAHLRALTGKAFPTWSV